MRKIKWILRIILLLCVGAFFHYVLPQHDVVRFVSTSEKYTDFSVWNRMFYASADSGNTEGPSRDVTLFHAFYASGGTIVYRNEDTGWIWPPYFKFDSADLLTETRNLMSTEAAPQWVSVTHYGWRIPFLGVYPNAVAVRPVASPDVTIIPYFNIGFFLVLFGFLLFLRAMWRQFWERSVEPVVTSASNSWDQVEAGVSERKSRWGRWFDSWRTKPRR